VNLPGCSFVWPVAYDWLRGVSTIAKCWAYGDEHIVSWDVGGRTWGGGRFLPPTMTGFASALVEAGVPAADVLDTRRLRFCLGDFYMPPPAPVDIGEVETRQRNAITWLARPGNLICTLDADEEPVNFPEWREWVGHKQNGAQAWLGLQLPIFKIIGDVALAFPPCRCPVAIGAPGIWDGPRAAAGTDSPLKIVNWFLAGRSEDELRVKLGAMTYMNGYDAEVMLNLWRETDLTNYGKVLGFAGTYQRMPLVPLTLADLWAGRWDELIRLRPGFIR
jgi:hypothetical protein